MFKPNTDSSTQTTKQPNQFPKGKNFLVPMKTAIIGGDLRQIYLARYFQELGFPIMVYGNDASYYNLSQKELDEFHLSTTIASSLEQLITENTLLLCPIPLTKDHKTIFTQPFLQEKNVLRKQELTLEHFLSLLTKDHMLFGGGIPSYITEHCNTSSIPIYDLMKQDTVAIENAIATAEGTILEAIARSPIILHKSKCLVLGYGRCAKVLADKLKALHAHVTICARKKEALALSNAFGFETLSLSSLEFQIESYDFIFNTIPSMILSKSLLEQVNPAVTIIDIASAPGGTDFDVANTLGRNASLCLGLPGKYAPKTSASILLNAICSILQSTSPSQNV